MLLALNGTCMKDQADRVRDWKLQKSMSESGMITEPSSNHN